MIPGPSLDFRSTLAFDWMGHGRGSMLRPRLLGVSYHKELALKKWPSHEKLTLIQLRYSTVHCIQIRVHPLLMQDTVDYRITRRSTSTTGVW